MVIGPAQGQDARAELLDCAAAGDGAVQTHLVAAGVDPAPLPWGDVQRLVHREVTERSKLRALGD